MTGFAGRSATTMSRGDTVISTSRHHRFDVRLTSYSNQHTGPCATSLSDERIDKIICNGKIENVISLADAPEIKFHRKKTLILIILADLSCSQQSNVHQKDLNST